MKTPPPSIQYSSGNPSSFIKGLKAAIPIAVGYIPIAITFGLVAKSAGIPNCISMLMSFIVFAGSSQFVAVNLITLGANTWEIVFTTFIINLRHLLMTASLSQRIDSRISKKLRSLIAFGVTDETFTVTSLCETKLIDTGFILGLNFLAFISWQTGTWIGIFLAAGLPASLKTSMGIALYAMFIGLIVPPLRDSKPVLIVVLLAILIHSILCWAPLSSSISSGWKIIIATVTAALTATVIFPQGVKQ